VRNVQGVEQDAGNKETGEREEKIDAAISSSSQLLEEIKDTMPGIIVCQEEMVDEYEQDSQSPDAIERRYMFEAARIFLVCRGPTGGR